MVPLLLLPSASQAEGETTTAAAGGEGEETTSQTPISHAALEEELIMKGVPEELIA